MITISADIPQVIPFVPVSPVTMPSDWTYSIPDAMAETIPPSDICEFEFAARPGQVGALDVNVSVPASRSGVTVLPYIESGANRWDLTETLATPAGAAISTTFPEFPEGTTTARLGFELREPASGAVLGTNLFTDPRTTTTSLLGTRYSWTLEIFNGGTTSDDLEALTGVRRYGAVTCHSTATGSGRGINLYQSTDGGTPASGVGFDVSGLVGETLTISGYIRSTNAGTVQASARCFSGTTWTAAATTGTATAIVANTWTRYSVTITVPAGATRLCATFLMTSSVAWVVGERFRIGAVLVEKTGTPSTYFDGETANTATEGYYWTGTPDASTSVKYNLTGGATEPNRSLIVSGLTMAVTAQAEEVVGAALTRPLRRSVYDALNTPAPQIAIGTPGLLAGSITYLCSTLEDALVLDSVYQFPGLITLSTGGALDGFRHMAIEQLRLTAERAVPGKPSRWLVQAEVRELE